MRTDFLGSAYTSRSLPLACQTLVNLFFEPGAPGTPDGMFYDAPGRKLFAAVGTGPIRGMRTVAGIGFVVSGGSLYRVLPDGNQALIGAVPGSGRVHLSNNDTQLVVMHSVGWHVLDVATLTYGAVPNAPTTAQGTFQDSYIVFPTDDGTYGWTAIGNATLIDGLDFASAEAQPDPVVAVLSDHLELWLFGETTTEIAQTSGDADLVFTRTAMMEHGCAAKYSPAKADNSVFWLGRDENGQGVVFRAEGYSPSRVSTYALEAAITGYTVEDAFGFCYQQGGHTFYVLTFPEATWAFDIGTNRWTQLAYRDPSTGELERVRDNAYMFLAGKHLVGDHTSGKVCQLDLNTFTDDGAAIHRERAWAVIENGGNWLRHNALQLMAEMGVGLVSGQGSDPVVLLDWSDDGGRTWSNTRELRLGRIGEYRNRARTQRLGISRARVYRLRSTDPVPHRWYGVNLDATAGRR